MADEVEQAVAKAEAIQAALMSGQIQTIRTRNLKLGADDCEDCGKELDALRRKAMPSATRCVPCQHSAELRARAYLGKGA